MSRSNGIPARTRVPLESLSFFMADAQAGIGPFLGVFLQQRRWDTSAIGLIMTIGGVVGMLLTAPAGALIDATKRKREYVVVSCAFAVLASGIVLLSQNFWAIAASQIATAIAGAAIGPGIVGITLGIAGQKGFNQQNGRNQAFNHAGNVAGAALSGFLGWKFGLPAVFWLAAAFAVLAIASALLVPRASIDDRVARGLESGESDRAQGFSILLQRKPLLILAACLAFFHLGNGGMLPLYGLAVVAAHQGNPAALVALTIVVAQCVMIVVSILAMRTAERDGYWIVLLISFLALPIRGIVAAAFIKSWGVYPVEALDGIGAGLQSVAVPGFVARTLDKSGRVNVGQGALMTVQGVGASLSPAFGGALAQHFGYPATFLTLGSLALASTALWVAFRGVILESR